MSQTVDRPWVKVWDPLVRYGHWALVAAFATAYLSAEEESGGADQLHVWSGYAVGIIVAARILWGLIGPRHTRFSDFAYSPISALRYFGDLVRGDARRYIGHSPIGAAMVVALLVCLSGTVWTGLGNFVTPMVQAEETSFPPVLAILSTVAFSVLFGPLGVLLAAPLTLLLMAAIEIVYVQEGLGEAPEATTTVIAAAEPAVEQDG
jgi:hypothetical protein